MEILIVDESQNSAVPVDEKQRASLQTTKSTSLQTFVNKDTGEEIEVFVDIKETKDSNFHKIWLEDCAKIMAEIGGSKIIVFTHILSNINRISNEFGGTNREISEATGVSLSVVNQTIQDLIRLNFMVKKRVACYIINPNLLVQGTYGKRKGILRIYQSSIE